MAGFCRNCGNPLADGQGFCTKCGTRVGDAPAIAASPVSASAPPPATPPVYATPPVQGAPVAAAPRAAGVSPLVKLLIALVIIFVAFGAFASVALLYIGHRVHQKATELGLNRSDEEREASNAELRRIDGCTLLPKSAVSMVVHMDIVRAENPSGSDPGCAYSVAGDPADMTAKHLGALRKGELNQQQQNTVQDFAKGILKSGNRNQPASEHPGEAPVLAYSIDNNAAQLQMRLNRATLGQMGPIGLVAIPNLGDEAFDAYGAMLFVRKGDKLVRIIYTSCPCGSQDIVPLARTIVAGL